MLCVGWAVDEVPGFQRPLLAFDQQKTFAGEDEEVLLRVLAVIAAARLSRLEHADREADLSKRRVVALDDAGIAEDGIRHPCGVAHVDDEPAVGGRDEAGIRLLQARFVGQQPIYRPVFAPKRGS